MFRTTLCLISLIVLSSGATASGGRSSSSSAPKTVHVNSYTKKDGTVVQAHDRAPSGPRTGARTSAPSDPPVESRVSARGPAASATPPPDSVESETAAAPPATLTPGSTPTKKREETPLLANGRIVPKRVGTVDIPLPAGKLAVHVEKYEEAIALGRKPAASSLLNDNEVIMIESPTPVAMEAIRGGWVYCRPTEGLHSRRMIVVREQYFVR